MGSCKCEHGHTGRDGHDAVEAPLGGGGAGGGESRAPGARVEAGRAAIAWYVPGHDVHAGFPQRGAFRATGRRPRGRRS